MPVPDPDAEGMDIREFAMEPGDAVAFNYMTLHGARGNTSTTRRRAFSLRLVGDDARYVERPGAGPAVKKGDAPCVVDSVKAASDVYAPVSGTVTESNAALADAPELVNTAADSDGWLFRMTLSDASELDGLMDQAAYDEYVKGL